MKQKKLNNILYVFDVNPYTITEDIDAEIIKVQEESYDGFVEMNQDISEKIVKYNYHLMCVKVPEWAPYVEHEDPQEQLTFGIYGAGAVDAINQIQVQNADNVIIRSWHAGVDLEFPFQTDVEEGQHCAIECKEGIDDLFYEFIISGSEYLPVIWEDQETGNMWYATDTITENISIGIDVVEPSTHTVTLDGINIHQHVTVKMDNETVQTEYQYQNVADGTVVDIYPTDNVADYDLQGGAVWDTDHWTATVYRADLTITINYDNRADAGIEWSSDNATVTIDDPNNVFPTLSNPNSLTVSYNASNPEYASIDQSTGEITLVAAGDTWIDAQFAGSETYKSAAVSYLLTVQESAQ
jgi:hypothetical protein